MTFVVLRSAVFSGDQDELRLTLVQKICLRWHKRCRKGLNGLRENKREDYTYDSTPMNTG